MLDARRWYQTKSNRMNGVVSAVVSLLLFGFGIYQTYGSHVGTPTTKWLFIWGAIFAVGAAWQFVPERRRRRRAGPVRQGRHAGW